MSRRNNSVKLHRRNSVKPRRNSVRPRRRNGVKLHRRNSVKPRRNSVKPRRRNSVKPRRRNVKLRRNDRRKSIRRSRRLSLLPRCLSGAAPSFPRKKRKGWALRFHGLPGMGGPAIVRSQVSDVEAKGASMPNELERFRDLLRPYFCWSPTHATGKREIDGAQKSMAKAKMLQCPRMILRALCCVKGFEIEPCGILPQGLKAHHLKTPAYAENPSCSPLPGRSMRSLMASRGSLPSSRISSICSVMGISMPCWRARPRAARVVRTPSATLPPSPARISGSLRPGPVPGRRYGCG